MRPLYGIIILYNYDNMEKYYVRKKKEANTSVLRH